MKVNAEIVARVSYCGGQNYSGNAHHHFDDSFTLESARAWVQENILNGFWWNDISCPASRQPAHDIYVPKTSISYVTLSLIIRENNE